jgi:hypothetical protein
MFFLYCIFAGRELEAWSVIWLHTAQIVGAVINVSQTISEA